MRGREIADLPQPVQRYFRAVLKEGQPLIAAARVSHQGTFNMSETDPTISQTTGLSIEDVRNLRSQRDFFANNNHNCKAPDTLAFFTLEIRIKDPDFTAILGFHS